MRLRAKCTNIRGQSTDYDVTIDGERGVALENNDQAYRR